MASLLVLLTFLVTTQRARSQPEIERNERYIIGGGATEGISPEGTTIFGTLGQPLLGMVDDDDEQRFILKRGLVDGFWHRSLPDRIALGISEPQRSTSVGVIASPLPARDRITLTFSLAEPASISVALHDLLGRELQRIDAGEMEGGSHRIALDLGNVPGGQVICTIISTRDGIEHTQSILLPVVK